MYPSSAKRVISYTTIRRERLLPVRGEVLVNPGEKVAPPEIVAQAKVPTDFRVVDVGRALGLQAPLPTKVRADVGKEVKKGDILGQCRIGLSRRVCRSPVDGTVIAILGERMLLELPPRILELPASLPGQVVNVIPNFGVVIETSGALIEGRWGTGGETFGVLRMLVDRADEVLTADRMGIELEGCIVVGGSGVEPEALKQATRHKVRGLIVGGLPVELWAAPPALPIVVTEGLGSRPMAPPIFELLSAHNGSEVFLSGRVQLRDGALPPEIIIPYSRAKATQPEQKEQPLQVGQRVRILRSPYLGAVGQVVNLPRRLQRVDSDAWLPVAEVSLSYGEKVFVPLANLEVLV